MVHPFLDDNHPTIDEHGKKFLTDPITKAEVFPALNTMKPYKAPGPDRFQAIFFKQYWHVVGEDIFQLVKTSFLIGYFDPAISDSLISLIPKIDPPKSYKDFRPISLCNIVYKIITKVLVLLTIKLIMHCVTSSSLSILWNGNKLPPFKPSHGLRQGDPLSPYLFILCMEKLSIAINKAVLQGDWDPIQISNNKPRLSHLLFADDVLLFTKAKNSQLRVITDLFDRFSRASGLKINYLSLEPFILQVFLKPR